MSQARRHRGLGFLQTFEDRVHSTPYDSDESDTAQHGQVELCDFDVFHLMPAARAISPYAGRERASDDQADGSSLDAISPIARRPKMWSIPVTSSSRRGHSQR